jgi:hypothetical protein
MESSLQLKYRGLVTHLAEQPNARDWTSSDDLPRLTFEQLGAVLQHYPAALIEALEQYEPTVTNNIRERLGLTQHAEDLRAALVGTVLICAIEQYVKPLVLRDVQTQIENNRIADALELQSERRGVFTADQVRAFSLGVSRLFSCFFLVTLVGLLSGCALAPNTVRSELAHQSHIGQHFGGDRTNFGAQYAEVIARWKFRGAYVDVGQGYNLSSGMGAVMGDSCPGGICGPRELTTVAVGYEWRVK